MLLTTNDPQRAVIEVFESCSELIQHVQPLYKGEVKGRARRHMAHDWWGSDKRMTAENMHEAITFENPDTMATITKMSEAIKELDLPKPKSRLRRPRWCDMAGTVDVDRAMSGDPYNRRRSVRQRVTGPTNVTIFANCQGNGGVTAQQMFWRGAACIAAIDILEDLGYGCEAWCWSFSHKCYNPPQFHTRHFSAFKLKESGQPVNVPAMANGLSAWIFRCGIHGSRIMRGNHTSGLGQSLGTQWSEDFRQYVNCTPNELEVFIPRVTTMKEAIQATGRVLMEVIESQE